MTGQTSKLSINRRQVILAIFLVIALYILLPQLSVFRHSWQLLGSLNFTWFIVAVVLTLSTYLFAALTYCLLALQPLHYGEVVIVQFAAMLVNRLLPAGVGGLGANYAYLRHKNHTPAQSATVVASNNLLGIVGHLIIIVVVLAVTSDYSRHMAYSSIYKAKTTLWLIAIIIVTAVVLGLIFVRKRLKQGLATIGKQLGVYKHQPWKLSGAVLSSMMLTLCNIACLYICMLAVGVHLPFIIIVLIFSFGISTGTVTPTPGGLGGFEAGLTAGFVAYHVGSASALAIALLFRLVSYWLMLIIGAIAFTLSQRQHLFSS